MFGEWGSRDVLRTALRAVTRRPSSSIILIVTMGLGIGATTAIFTVVDAVLLRPAPFREPVMHAAGDSAAIRAHSASLATAVVRELRLQSAAFRALPLNEG